MEESPKSAVGMGRSGSRDATEREKAGLLAELKTTNREEYEKAVHFGYWLRLLPVVFVACLIGFLYLVYGTLHLWPMLQLTKDVSLRDDDLFKRGLSELITFHVLFLMFAACYIRAVCTPAGTIPADWTTGEFSVRAIETKKAGTRRHCKWCEKYKPDRAHHCRQCRQCVLKMDHHCPWLFNCVGWGNHKFFLLCLLYGCATAALILSTEVESVKVALRETHIRFGVLTLLLFAEALSGLLALVCGAFLLFHFWICSSNMSTIEFCEKHFRHGTSDNVYNRGVLKNLVDVFGRNPLLWFLPIDNRPGDGLHFKLA